MPHTELGGDILAAVAARIEENTKRSLISLQELLQSTQFSKQEIMIMYRGFKQVRLCTGGLNR
jgi:hypothetical protein